jgi:hypothetical protein
MDRRILKFSFAGGIFFLLAAVSLSYVASLRDWFPGENALRSVLLGFSKLPAYALVPAGIVVGFAAEFFTRKKA